MNINDYQEYVKNGSSEKYTKQLSIIGLIGEVGELADVVKKEVIYEDMSKFIEKYGMSIDEKIIDEAGDCLWQFINILNQYNIPIDTVINKNVEKLNERHGNKKVAKDGGGVR